MMPTRIFFRDQEQSFAFLVCSRHLLTRLYKFLKSNVGPRRQQIAEAFSSRFVLCHAEIHPINNEYEATVANSFSLPWRDMTNFTQVC